MRALGLLGLAFVLGGIVFAGVLIDDIRRCIRRAKK